VALMSTRSSNNNIVITRGNVAQVASFVGVAALLAGLIGLVLTGELTLYVGIALALGAAGIALWAIMTPAEFIGFITGRRMRYSTTAVFSTLLLIGIVSMAYLLLARSALVVDMTGTTRFTLSETSINLLRRVTRPMQITGFYSPAALPLREIDDQFLRLYENQTNGMIRRVFIDPEQQPALAQRYGLSEDAQLFISYLTDTGEVDFNTLARIPRSSNQERDVSEAISRMLIAGSIVVYFERGLGTRDPLDTSAEGISGVNDGMRESGIGTLPLSLPQIAETGGDIPANAAAVLFPRPLRDLTEAEIAVIDRYLARGGSLYLMADALFNEDAFLKQDGAFNAYLWENYGIRALDAVVVDPAASGQTALDVVGAAVFTGTDISARLNPETSPTMFRVARAVDVDINRSIPNVANGRIIMSTEAAYGETNLTALAETNTYAYDAGQDLTGPLTTVVWAWNQENDSRIMLMGDSDFASNGLVLTGDNGVLFTDAVSWLTHYNEELRFGFQTYTLDTPLIFVDFQTLDLIAFLTVILMPGVVLVIGLGIWMRRVRRS
jgi:ABC-type uncharacterized transport system involved in gliding motility auxiliary subunit